MILVASHRNPRQAARIAAKARASGTKATHYTGPLTTQGLMGPMYETCMDRGYGPHTLVLLERPPATVSRLSLAVATYATRFTTLVAGWPLSARWAREFASVGQSLKPRDSVRVVGSAGRSGLWDPNALVFVNGEPGQPLRLPGETLWAALARPWRNQ